VRLDDPDLLSKAMRRHRRGSGVWQRSLHPQKIGDDAARLGSPYAAETTAASFTCLTLQAG
jgi:hypothetical protein